MCVRRAAAPLFSLRTIAHSPRHDAMGDVRKKIVEIQIRVPREVPLHIRPRTTCVLLDLPNGRSKKRSALLPQRKRSTGGQHWNISVSTRVADTVAKQR